MPITITKKKPQEMPFEATPPAVPASDSLSLIRDNMDEAVEAQERIEKIKKKVKALEATMAPDKEILSKFSAMIDGVDLSPDDGTEIDTEKNHLEIKAQGQSRSIKDMEKIKKMLGGELFMKLAKVNLKDVDDYLNPIQRAEVLDVTRTSRGFKLTAK